jgi:hypothetical protein
MLQRITFSLIMFFLTWSVSAQTFSLGPRFGINMASLTHYALDSQNDKAVNSQFISIHTGLITKLDLTDQFALQGEILYSRKGHRLSLDWDTTDYSQEGYSKFALDYLEIPLLLKASFGPREVRFFVNAGPYWGFWLGGVKKYKLDIVQTGVPDESFSDKTRINFEEDWANTGMEANKRDFGAVIGGGFAYESGPGFMMIDFRYSMSFRDINNWIDESLKPEAYKEKKNRVFSISFGYVYEF